MAVHKKYNKSVLGRGLDDLGNGRGLDALIDTGEVQTQGSSNLNEIAIDHIEPNPNQPRREFDEEALQELAASIREIGIIQPVTLRQTADGRYQIIAGERRYRAAKLAGLHSVPAYIRTASETELTEMALIENIQREDLNAIEIALTFKKLIDQYNLTQERLSERIGKKRATIANFLRLLRLPAEVQLGLRDRRVDMGHARALLSVENPTLQLKLYERIIKEGLSVRKVEELAKSMREEKPEKPQREDSTHDFDLLKNHLTAKFKTPVAFACDRNGKGKITFSFKNEDELDRLIRIFDEIKQSDTRQ